MNRTPIRSSQREIKYYYKIQITDHEAKRKNKVGSYFQVIPNVENPIHLTYRANHFFPPAGGFAGCAGGAALVGGLAGCAGGAALVGGLACL